jgi:hypothetical protein
MQRNDFSLMTNGSVSGAAAGASAARPNFGRNIAAQAHKIANGPSHLADARTRIEKLLF